MNDKSCSVLTWASIAGLALYILHAPMLSSATAFSGWASTKPAWMHACAFDRCKYKLLSYLFVYLGKFHQQLKQFRENWKSHPVADRRTHAVPSQRIPSHR